MGYIKHNAILVTTSCDQDFAAVLNMANKLFNDLVHSTPSGVVVSPTVMNGYRTILIPPDGSKEGWQLSDDWDTKREEFISFLKECPSRHVYPCWAEVRYGGDDPELAKIIDHDREEEEA